MGVWGGLGGGGGHLELGSVGAYLEHRVVEIDLAAETAFVRRAWLTLPQLTQLVMKHLDRSRAKERVLQRVRQACAHDGGTRDVVVLDLALAIGELLRDLLGVREHGSHRRKKVLRRG